MDILQVVVIGIVSAVLAVTIKKQSPEFAVGISIAASVLIFLMVLPQLSVLFGLLNNLSEQIGTSASYMLIVLRIVGIAYISEFGAQLCIDAGESSIASKIEIAGKVLIMVVSAPILLSVLDLLGMMLSS